jgi:hypothetical protein
LRAAAGAHSSSQDTGGVSRSEGGGMKEWRVDVPKPLGLILKQGDRAGSAGVWGSEFVSSSRASYIYVCVCVSLTTQALQACL